MKSSTIRAYFKRKNVEAQTSSEISNSLVGNDQLNSQDPPRKSLRIEIKDRFDINSLERDPGIRPHI